MADGTPVRREYLYVMNNGAFVIDWGDGQVQDLMTGEFSRAEDSDFGHVIYDAEMDILVRCRRVLEFNSQEAVIVPLPENSRKMLS